MLRFYLSPLGPCESPCLVCLFWLIGEEYDPHAILHEVGLQGYLVPGLDGEPLALGGELTEEFLMRHAFFDLLVDLRNELYLCV